jgi:solute carrier family 25 S-adenosylmethionine transporter 26
MAAACVKTTLQPIDAVKTLQQYRQANGSSLTVLGACREILARPGGFSNFYSGLGVTVAGSMPSVALYFGVYSYCKNTFADSRLGKKYPTASIALSAAIGNSVASFSRVPYEVMKQKLQTQVYSSTWEALRDVASSKQKFWSLLFPKGGVAIQMIRDVPYAVVTLMIYEALQASLHKSRTNKKLDFCIGGISGGVGSWVTTPMDVVKTRLQTDSALYGGSVVQCAREVWLEGGAPAFLRGSVPRLMHKIPANSFFFLFYEVFRRLLGVEDAGKRKAK